MHDGALVWINFHALYLRAKIWNIPNTSYAGEHGVDTKNRAGKPPGAVFRST